MQLALDKATNDLFKPAGGGVTRVEDGRFTVQQVQSRLSTLLGEWSLDPTIGWLDFSEDYNKATFLFDLETRAKTIILDTKGVQEILSINFEFSKRVLLLTFTAMTIYGEINLTIPWTL